MLTQSEWEIQYLERIQKNKRLNGTEKTILELKNTENNTEFQKKMLTRLLNNEYRKYSIQESLKESLQKIDSQSKDFVKNIKAKQPNLRKQRAHQLIRIGALTELTGFTKDRGLIAGTFLYVKALIEQNPALENELKAQGDNLITKKEYQNTIKKLKNKTENNTKTID